MFMEQQTAPSFGYIHLSYAMRIMSAKRCPAVQIILVRRLGKGIFMALAGHTRVTAHWTFFASEVLNPSHSLQDRPSVISTLVVYPPSQCTLSPRCRLDDDVPLEAEEIFKVLTATWLLRIEK